MKTYNVYAINKSNKNGFSEEIQEAFDKYNKNSSDNFILVVKDDNSFQFHDMSEMSIYTIIHEIEKAYKCGYEDALEENECY